MRNAYRDYSNKSTLWAVLSYNLQFFTTVLLGSSHFKGKETEAWGAQVTYPQMVKVVVRILSHANLTFIHRGSGQCILPNPCQVTFSVLKKGVTDERFWWKVVDRTVWRLWNCTGRNKIAQAIKGQQVLVDLTPRHSENRSSLSLREDYVSTPLLCMIMSSNNYSKVFVFFHIQVNRWAYTTLLWL